MSKHIEKILNTDKFESQKELESFTKNLDILIFGASIDQMVMITIVEKCKELGQMTLTRGVKANSRAAFTLDVIFGIIDDAEITVSIPQNLNKIKNIFAKGVKNV